MYIVTGGAGFIGSALIWKLNQQGMDVIEIPIIWNDTGDSRLQTSDAFTMFLTLLRLRMGVG